MPFSQALLLADEARSNVAMQISLMRLAIWGDAKDVNRVTAELQGLNPLETAGEVIRLK